MNGKEFKDLMINLKNQYEELKTRAASTTKADELEEIEAKMTEIEAQKNIAIGERKAEMKSNVIDFTVDSNEQMSDIEKRGADLKSGKAVKVSFGDVHRRAVTTSANIVIPKKYDNTVHQPLFPTISSLYEKLNFISLDGGESYTVPFEKNYPTGGTTAEGAAYSDGTIAFDYVTIGRQKITVYFELSEEVLKLPAADYEACVNNELDKALRRKIVSLVINGDGTTGFSGILSTDDNAVKCIPVATDKSISALDGTFLRDVALSYGYNEDTATEETIVLNKVDLATLGKVAGKKNEFAYELSLRDHTIDNIPYIISKDINKFVTTSAAYFGFYGDPHTYTVAVYSPVEIAKSTESKFKEGMIAYKASVFVGGAPTELCGLMRLKSVKAGS